MQIRFLKKHPDAIVPQYATAGASGLDLHARIPHDIYLQPGVRFTCHGFFIALEPWRILTPNA